MGEVLSFDSPLALADAEALLFDTSGIDVSARVCGKDGIHKWIPHRGDMSLVDAIVHTNEAGTELVGLKNVREGEFWIPGHFPEMPVLPGVLMVEAAAQLMCWMYNNKRGVLSQAAFLRIGDCSFRNGVTVGDDLYFLVKELKFGSRGFSARVQGLIENKIAFEADLRGMVVPDSKKPKLNP